LDTWGNEDYLTYARRISTMVALPNVGRCDHTYAHHFATMVHDGPPLLLMVKDTDLAHLYHLPLNVVTPPQLVSAVQTATLYGFGCTTMFTGGSAFFLWAKLYHHGATCHTMAVSNGQRHPSKDACLRESKKTDFLAPVRPLGRWIEWVGVYPSVWEGSPDGRAPRAVAPVCVGGSFATSRLAAQRAPLKDGWARVAKALSRGDNIEEGHFMERMWAVLLSRPLPADLQRRVVCASTAMAAHKDVVGQLRHCRCPRFDEAMALSDSLDTCIAKLTPVNVSYLSLNTTDHSSFVGEAFESNELNRRVTPLGGRLPLGSWAPLLGSRHPASHLGHSTSLGTDQVSGPDS